MRERWIMAGAVLGFISVAMGAFGAHALREILSPNSLTIYQTATLYLIFHSLAMISWGIWHPLKPLMGFERWAGPAFLSGCLLFSGSLYALALTELKPLGAITPLGGIAFLIGWASFAKAAAVRAKSGSL